MTISTLVVEYRYVLNDVTVFPWKVWEELGEFETVESAINSIRDEWILGGHQGFLGWPTDVSFAKTGLYQFDGYPNYQFRIVTGVIKGIPPIVTEVVKRMASQFDSVGVY